MEIRVTINFEDKGFSAYSHDVPNVLLLAEGETIDEVKAEMISVIEEVFEDEEALHGMEYTISWGFSVSTFLNKFSPLISQSGLAELAGINPSQLSLYKSGIRNPGAEQVAKLQQAVTSFAHDLLNTPLVTV